MPMGIHPDADRLDAGPVPLRANGVGMTATAQLFDMPTFPGEQEYHTPRWIFDAMGLHFDIDVAAPVAGPAHVPCDRWFSVQDDGLVQPWEGLIWCNPPFRDFAPWAERWAAHDRGVIVGLMTPYHRGRRVTFDAAEYVVFLPVAYTRKDGSRMAPIQATFLGFRGVERAVVDRLASCHASAGVLRGAA